jgi:hypothetical protein
VRADAVLQVARQPREEVEAVIGALPGLAHAVALELRRGRRDRRHRADARAADRAQGEALRQPRHERGVDHAGGHPAFHHDIAFLGQKIVHRSSTLSMT